MALGACYCRFLGEGRDPNPACVGQQILLDVQGAVLALVVLQYDTNLSLSSKVNFVSSF